MIIAGGLGAIQTAMVIGALPFSLIVLLMGLSLIKAIWREGLREKHGLATTHAGPKVEREVEPEATPAE